MKNISASVKQRLLNHSKREEKAFSTILQYYAMERFLYRLSQSSHAQSYILKGALMLRAWNSPKFRPTMDIDMLGKIRNDENIIIPHILDILAVEVEPDGLIFDMDSVQTEKITEDAYYGGVRVRFHGFLDTARIHMQIDIGFGDIIYPEPQKVELPCMLRFPETSILCYSRESAIAEKFEAMIKLGNLNSRMKDFYDIWLLSHQFRFELRKLAKAVNLTFKQRGTELNQPVEAFSTQFISSHQAMWKAFRKRIDSDQIPEYLENISQEIKLFLSPVIDGISENMVWKPAGPWSID